MVTDTSVDIMIEWALGFDEGATEGSLLGIEDGVLLGSLLGIEDTEGAELG
jgi:hypothetical protein